MIIGRHYQPHQLVFLDESHCNRHASRRPYAWSPVGTRARRRDFFVWGQKYVFFQMAQFVTDSLRCSRYSMLPALSLDGILAFEVLEHSYTAEDFDDFVECLLDRMNPFPLPNSVLVMDNASAHHSGNVRELVEAR